MYMALLNKLIKCRGITNNNAPAPTYACVFALSQYVLRSQCAGRTAKYGSEHDDDIFLFYSRIVRVMMSILLI